MPVSIAYLAVIIIWSTTPLGIVWSTESVDPALAVLLRMLIAVVLGIIGILLTRIELPWHKNARKLYIYSSVGIFGGMMFSYLAAQTVSSGLISLIFGLAPVLSGLLAQRILGEAKFGLVKWIAFTIAILGLFIVCSDQISINDQMILGLVYVFCAVILFSLSGVLVKRIQISIHPFATTVGALIFCIPMFTLAWLAMGAEVNVVNWSYRSIWAIVYLGVIGSLIGFLAYFFVLQKLPPSTVALATMITPVIAICLGAVLNNEHISVNTIVGALIVMLGLGLYQFGTKMFRYDFGKSFQIKN